MIWEAVVPLACEHTHTHTHTHTQTHTHIHTHTDRYNVHNDATPLSVKSEIRAGMRAFSGVCVCVCVCLCGYVCHVP